MPMKRENGVANMRNSRARALRLGTRSAAIRGFCVECVGGDLAEARNCCSKECLLWRFRMGAVVKGDFSLDPAAE